MRPLHLFLIGAFSTSILMSDIMTAGAASRPTYDPSATGSSVESASASTVAAAAGISAGNSTSSTSRTQSQACLNYAETRKVSNEIRTKAGGISASTLRFEKTHKFKVGNRRMYHEGWIDFNKNGIKDIYEDPQADIDERIEDLLTQMTLEEKTCQMVTLYGYRRVLSDMLPTDEWKEKLWKDGIGAIDEHLNGFYQWGLPIEQDNPYLWPASLHAAALNEVQRFFVEETRLGIPTDFTNEGIRGVEAFKATTFPTQLGIGHTWDRELVREIGRITGREGRLLGYTNVYAPILDVGRDQRWGRYEEVYGESPYLVAELGMQMTLGMQSLDSDRHHQVAATAKHYAAYSNNKGAREGMSRVDPQMSPREVENIHLYPWREVIAKGGLLGAMASYNDYDGVPVEGSHYWLTERLRNDFGFKGYVVSDSDAVEYLYTKHHVAEDMKEAVKQSVEAGLNVRCTFRAPDGYVLPLRELVKEGTVSMETIDSRVRDILRVKFLTGAFDHPYQLDYEAADKEVNGEEHNSVALRASLESLVLLKNSASVTSFGTDGKTLPLNASALKRVAVIGPNADNTEYAHFHYGPLATKAVSVYDGLKKALEGKAEVKYAKGCELVDKNWPLSEILPTDPDPEELGMIAEAVKIAEESDVAIVVLGGGGRTSGENKSRSSLELPGRQNLLLKEIKKTGKPVVVVLINGRPLSVNYADAVADAIIEAWYPGAHGGTAIAAALLGDYNPGGKLTVTFPKTVGQIPFNFPFKPASQVDSHPGTGPEGKQSRINGALYDFGYGLSYTEFKYSDLHLSLATGVQDKHSDNADAAVSQAGDGICESQNADSFESTGYGSTEQDDDEIGKAILAIATGIENSRLSISPTDSVRVSFDITNTGKVKGDEVVQLYIHDRVSSVTVYEKSLRGFERVTLEPGETKTVTMLLTPEDLSLIDINMNRVVEPGDFDIFVAASSTDVRLDGLLSVVDPDAKEDTAVAEKSSYPVSLKRGEFFTVDVPCVLNKAEIVFDASTDCAFQIQTTNGGGQFITATRGTAKGETRFTHDFDAENAAELRIVIDNGSATVKNIILK